MNPADPLALAIFYVLTVWVIAEAITLGLFVALSLAPFSDLLEGSLWTSACAMWLVPGLLLLAARSPAAAVAGAAAVMSSTRMLALSRAPKHRMETRAASEWSLSGGTRATILGALALQIAVAAAAGEYPLLAAVSFAAAAAIWTARSVASGATEARTANAAPYTGTRAALTLLLTAR